MFDSVRGLSARHVFYRKLNRELPTVVRAEGVYLYDSDGKRYLDACGGAMVACIGHGVAEVADAIGEQARRVAYVNGTAFTNLPAERLADVLAKRAPPGIDKAYFLSSGSEAVEAALKLARQYHVERGESSRRFVIALNPGYHGNTLLALSASARSHYRAVFSPWLLDVRMIDAPYPYRADETAASMSGQALQAAIRELGAENVAAFIAEPVGGSSTGASVAPAGYFAAVREICDRSGVLFIADEILSGSGRTGTFFALEHFRDATGGPVVPDIITLGKSLNGGYAPLSALLARSSIVETLASGPHGGLMHAQTYSHNPLACAAALAVQKFVEKHELVRRASAMGDVLQRRLASLARDGDGADIVGDVRGLGMLAAIELVADRRTKQPFERSLNVAERLVASAHARGLVLWPNVGHADGRNGDLVMIAPPYTIANEQIEELVDLLRAALADTAHAVLEPSSTTNAVLERSSTTIATAGRDKRNTT